jgi:hypothetical protein
MREVSEAFCSCSGRAVNVAPTAGEERVFGCGRKWCCVEAYECNECGVRFTFSLEAPEMGY